MTENPVRIQPENEQVLPKTRTGSFARVAKYTLVRILALGVTLIIGMFVAVVVLNFGGYIDQIYRANIEESLAYMAAGMKDVTQEEKVQLIDQARYAMEEARGLHRPFLLRCVHWTIDALRLRLGYTASMYMRGQTITVIELLLKERLPYTLLLFGVSNFIIFFVSLFLALYLFRKYEGLVDRSIVFLSPLSSIPAWLHGVFLVILFAAVLRVLPYPRSFNRGLDLYIKHDVGLLLKYMILPVAAIFLNMFFQSVYSWRTFFLLQAGEDYLELAKAKGLPDHVIERRYLLRPSLPYILTSLAMTMVSLWQMSLILEKFFFWPGIGSLFFDSLDYFPITGGIIVLFAYLLVITVFLLDIIYALVDPRVRIGSSASIGRVARKQRAPLKQRLLKVFSFSRPRARAASPARRNVAVPETRSSIDDSQPVTYIKPARALASAFKEIRRYPSAIVGLAIIASLTLVSIYTVIAIPYQKALVQWRGDDNIWVKNPKFAQPVWSNWFRKDKLPETIIMDSRDGSASKEVKVESATMKRVTVSFLFDYPYGGFPQDLVINIESKNAQKRPLVNLVWIRPDGREVKLDTFTMTSSYRYSFEYQWYHDTQNLLEVRNGPPPWEKLFVATGTEDKVVRGAYQLQVQGFVFDEGVDLDADMVLYGQVYGMAGTDDQRRDLSLAILWGTPFSLLFGLLGAFGTGLLAMTIAAIGVWFGGWVDGIIQRITEVNMLLPAFPMAIMIYFIYTHNIWIILGVIILLSVFGNALKNFRAAFLQAKESSYIEAAQVYSAGNWRIILRYMVPRIIPLLVPQLVALVPSYIFLEPTLAFIGIVDPLLPTWGKILMTGLFTTESSDTIYYMNLLHNPYLALEPIGLMFLTGLAFSLLGMSLDRIFNPRLRSL